jgi:alpha-mannosidase
MNQNVEVGQGNLKLRYSEEGVKITRHLSTKNQVTAEQSYAYYIGSNGTDKDPQASGAYVFRPDGVLPIKSKEEVIHISCIYNLISRQYVKTQKKN